MRPTELEPAKQVALHLAARAYHTTLLSMGLGAGTPHAYLLECGLTEATIHCEGVGYATGDMLGLALAVSGLPCMAAIELNLVKRATGHEQMAGRLVFLDCDQSGRILNLVGQRFGPGFDEHAPRYLSLSDRLPLFGYARLDTRLGQRPVLLVDTPANALLVRQWGSDALATLGTHLPREHIRLLNGLRRPLLIILSGDDSERRQTTLRYATLDKGLALPLPTELKTLSDFGATSDGEAWFASRLKAFGYERQTKNRRLDYYVWMGDQ